jgi:hypothetical protein
MKQKDAIAVSKPNNPIAKQEMRDKIMEFEEQLKAIDGVMIGDNDSCPLKHSFSDGIYVREIFIPAGMHIVGKIHKHEHPIFILYGTLDIVTEKGASRIQGPVSMMSPSGTKRAIRAITDSVLVTIHHNPDNITDLSELEELIIAKDYDEYDQLECKKNNSLS